jgi:hypothetical protein
MEYLFWLVVPFAVLCVFSLVRFVVLGFQFKRHLVEHHPSQHREIYEKDIFKKVYLWPVMKNTPVDFVFLSREDFGDARLAELRRGIKLNLLGFVSSAVATFVTFVVIAWAISAR